jgi:hypothetical protein
MPRLLLLVLLISIIHASTAQLSPAPLTSPKLGKYGVGYRVIRQKSKKGTPILISVWFPAKVRGSSLTLNDLIVTSNLTNESVDNSLVDRFQNIGLRLYPNVSGEEFRNGLNRSTQMFPNYERIDGTFPLVLAQSEPAALYETNTYLASHGFLVASINYQWQDESVDSLLYKVQTDIMEELLDFMLKQPGVNPNKVYAIGFGGGIQCAMYLAMRRSEIEKVINLDGGFFGPRSKSTVSVDYHPEHLSATLLTIETQTQQREDDHSQIQNLRDPIVSVGIKSELVRHHDFTSWGRTIASIGKRDNEEIVNGTFRAVHQLMLQFLEGKKIAADPNYLTGSNIK